MADADWDSENFEPKVVVGVPVTKVVASDKWEGEDDDDDVRDAWDQSDEEAENKPASSVTQVAKKKPLKERLAEKEEKKRKEQEERRKKEEEENKSKTPKELFEEKMRQQKIQQEADLALAIDAFGLGKESMKSSSDSIDSFVPSSKEEFEKYCELLVTKITKHEKSAHYEHFLESLYQKLALGLEAESIKKLASSLTALSNEKMKQQKGTNKKKKNQKASLVVRKDDDMNPEEVIYDEFDDYL